MAMSLNTIRDELVECLSQQISEYELLQSMYPNQGDITLTDKSTIDELNQFLEGKTEYVPNHLDFKINIQISGKKLEVFVNLPSTYPKKEPDIYVRCNNLNRQKESKLNAELSEYIKENYAGDVCLYTAIIWLQENIDNFAINEETPSVEHKPTTHKKDKFARFWVYSHHIYNKHKREEIVKRACQLNLTGFCLSGKPGLVCIEGPLHDCEDWWKDIKSMTWKKIIIRKTESFEPSEETTYKKFTNFKELNFKVHAHVRHSNMSELSKYMNELGLSHTFNEIFRLCSED